MVLSLLGFLSSALGIAILYLGWQRKIRHFHGAILCAAWLLVALSIYLWSLAHGAEFGVCYAFITLALQSWGLIATTRDKRLKTSRKIQLPLQPLALSKQGLQALPKHLWILISAVPLAGVSAMLLTVVSTALLPWQKVNMVALGIYTMPLVWGAAAYWACADSKPWRPAITFVLVGALAALIIYR